MPTEQDHHVGQYDKQTGKRLATISGMGRNKGKWEGNHSKRTANKYARQLNASDPTHTYRAEHIYG